MLRSPANVRKSSRQGGFPPHHRYRASAPRDGVVGRAAASQRCHASLTLPIALAHLPLLGFAHFLEDNPMTRHTNTHQLPASRGAVGSAVSRCGLFGAPLRGALNSKAPVAAHAAGLRVGH
jgi:hypothetical protein